MVSTTLVDALWSCVVRQTGWIGKVLSGAHHGSNCRLEVDHHIHPHGARRMGSWLAVLRVSVSEHHFRKTEVLAQSCPNDQAHLKSHSGGCSHVLHGCPTSPEFIVAPSVFRTIVLERVRLFLPVTETRCDCRALTDNKRTPLGRARTQDGLHEGSCTREDTGQDLQGGWGNCSCERQTPRHECRCEGNDKRCIEVVASGLPLYHGAQLAVDITMLCCLEQWGGQTWNSPRRRYRVYECQGRQGTEMFRSPEALEFVEGLARTRAGEGDGLLWPALLWPVLVWPALIMKIMGKIINIITIII